MNIASNNNGGFTNSCELTPEYRWLKYISLGNGNFSILKFKPVNGAYEVSLPCSLPHPACPTPLPPKFIQPIPKKESFLKVIK